MGREPCYTIFKGLLDYTKNCDEKSYYLNQFKMEAGQSFKVSSGTDICNLNAEQFWSNQLLTFNTSFGNLFSDNLEAKLVIKGRNNF